LTACGEHTSNVFRIPRFALGSRQTQDLAFVRGDDNLLGLAYLSRYKITFDFPNRVLYSRAGKAFDKPDPTDVSGLHLLRKEGATIVGRVDSDSAAEASGLEEDDIILAVDGLDADPTSLTDLRRVFRKGNRTVDVTYERHGHRLETTIELP